MKRTLLTVGLLLVGLLLLAEIASYARCCGSYELTVSISPESAAEVAGVSYLCVQDDDVAGAVVSSIDDFTRFMEHRSTTEPFGVHVGFSYESASFGRTWAHVQECSDIILVLHRDDGSRVVHRIKIPNRSVSREVVVTPANAVSCYDRKEDL